MIDLADIQEIRTFASIAKVLGFQFRMRGLAVEALADATENKSHSLLALTPPLAPIEFVVANRSQSYVLSSQARSTIPDLGFFKVVVSTENDQSSDLENVILTGEPAIAFGAEDSVQPGTAAVLLEGDKLKTTGDLNGSHVGASYVFRTNSSLISDLLNIIRRYPQLLKSDAAAAIVQRIHGEEPSKPFAATLDSGSTRRTKFELLAFLLSSDESTRSKLVKLLGESFLNNLGTSSGDSILSQLVEALLKGTRQLMGVVVPRPSQFYSAWLPEIELIGSVEERDDPSHSFIFDDVSGATQTLKIRNSVPPVSITVDDPPPTRCCHYQDFSRGVVEVVWRGQTPPNSSRFVLVSSGTAPDDDFFLAHSFPTSSPRGHSLRIDYGFLSLLAGRSRDLNLYYGGIHDAD